MKYEVTTNLKHDGTEYVPGSTIELGDAHAAKLLEAGAISNGAQAPEEKPEEPAQEVAPGPVEPKVGGEPAQSGEPSLDGEQPEKKDTAEDVTPVVSDKMTRAELEEEARKKGIEEAAIEQAPNKGALVELITGTAPAQQEGTTQEPEVVDPSANL